MIFALGFLFSGLLTLLFLPAFWRRAVRLSTRRIEMQMPLTMTEIVAERDQLRAEFAMEQRRIERRAEELTEARARDMSELGRRGAQIAALDGELADTRREALSLHDRLAEARRTITELEGHVGAANIGLHDAQALVDRRSGELAGLEKEYDELVEVAEERRALIAGLETRVSGLELRLMDSERETAQLRMELADRTSALALAERERDFARHDIALGNQKREVLQTRIDQLSAEKDEIENSLRAAQRERTRLTQHSSGVEGDLAAATQREAELRAAIEQQSRAAEMVERGYAERMEMLRGELSMVQGALEAMRREHAAQHGHPMPPAATPSPGLPDADLLRAAIVDVGAEISRLASALQAQPGPSDETLADRMRLLQARAGRSAG